MWNGSVDELSSCVINNMSLHHVILGPFFRTNLSVEFLSSSFSVLIYIFMFVMYCDLYA